MSFGPKTDVYWGLLASAVDKILRGGSAADIPVVGPTVFKLVVNRNTAKALNVRLPRTLLVRADDIVPH